MSFVLLALALTSVVQSASLDKAQAAVWEAKQNWSPAWEQKYRAWAQQNIDRDMFNRTTWYQGLKTDCADAVYSMRVIFAAENQLPFAIKDPSGSGIISNQMSRWDNLSAQGRVRSFMQFLYGVVGTSGIPNDTYPVAVNRNGITSGSVILTDRANHHSWTIRYVSETGIPFLVFSSRPAKTTMFERFEFPTRDFIFPNGLRPETHAGFRAFRPIEYLQRPVWEVPGYSLEQYQLPWKDWTKHVQARIQLKAESGSEQIQRTLGEACRAAQERVGSINDAQNVLARISTSSCLSAQQFDDLSTPSRDSRMKGSFTELWKAYMAAKQRGTRIPKQLEKDTVSVLNGDRSVSNSAYCRFKIASNKVVTLGQVYQRSMNDLLSSNPHDSIMARWGFEAHPGRRASACPKY